MVYMIMPLCIQYCFCLPKTRTDRTCESQYVPFPKTAATSFPSAFITALVKTLLLSAWRPCDYRKSLQSSTKQALIYSRIKHTKLLNDVEGLFSFFRVPWDRFWRFALDQHSVSLYHWKHLLFRYEPQGYTSSFFRWQEVLSHFIF